MSDFGHVHLHRHDNEYHEHYHLEGRRPRGVWTTYQKYLWGFIALFVLWTGAVVGFQVLQFMLPGVF